MKKGLVNFLVAGASTGKTTITAQIALAVAKGIRPEFLPPTSCESEKLNVVYYRLEDYSCELRDKYGAGEVFRDSGIKWVLPTDLKDFSLDGLLEHLKAKASVLTGDALVCVDPATKLPGYSHKKFILGAEEAQEIAKLKGHTLTILAVIHLDEIKDWAPLTTDKIDGGDMAIQQAGSITAMRKERTSVDHRFLQCLKEPKGSPKPFGGKVLVMKMENKQLDSENTYLHLVYVDTEDEAEALPFKPKPKPTAPVTPNVTAPAPQKTAPNQTVTPEDKKKMMDMLAKGVKTSAIAKKVHLSPRQVRRYKKDFNAKKTD